MVQNQLIQNVYENIVFKYVIIDRYNKSYGNCILIVNISYVNKKTRSNKLIKKLVNAYLGHNLLLNLGQMVELSKNAPRK